MQENSLQVHHGNTGIVSVFSNLQTFADGQRMASALAASTIVPKLYQGSISNCLIAVEMAQRIGASPLMVMQNLHIIQGRPSFSSKFLIATLNTSGRFSPMQYEISKPEKKTIEYEIWTGPDGQRKKEKRSITVSCMTCIAFAKDLRSGDILKGPPVTIEMAVREGWYTKNDSKWPNMPEAMLHYRAASFFVNTYCPEISMGMSTQEEAEDIEYIDLTPPRTKASVADDLALVDEMGETTVVIENQNNDFVVEGNDEQGPTKEEDLI